MSLKYVSYDIVFQEIPDEISLAVNLSGCPNGCPGCHSAHLQEDIGVHLTESVLDELLCKYSTTITCVCFMGGDADVEAVFDLARHVHSISSLKTAWYSGRELLGSACEVFDYIKAGGYVEALGGLDSEQTNQRLYKVLDSGLEDITPRFWKA